MMAARRPRIRWAIRSRRESCNRRATLRADWRGSAGSHFSAYDSAGRSTRAHQYSFDVQREAGKGLGLMAGLAGPTTDHLIRGTPGININQLPDRYLTMGSKLAAKVANLFYGTAGAW
jgi:hypothetical protein